MLYVTRKKLLNLFFFAGSALLLLSAAMGISYKSLMCFGEKPSYAVVISRSVLSSIVVFVSKEMASLASYS